MDVKIPEVGESILEGMIAKWHKRTGDGVRKDELICEFETDKVTVEIHADVAGTITVQVAEGETVPIGTTIALIDESSVPGDDTGREEGYEQKGLAAPVNPGARQLAEEQGVNTSSLQGSGRDGRVTVDDVLRAQSVETEEPAPHAVVTESAPVATAEDARTRRVPMSPLRKKIAERLLAARQQTAMLTTFNEADMSHILKLRRDHQDHFVKKHRVKLGLMSFFVKAVVAALKEFPEVNARIDGDDIIYHNYYNVGIAVGGDKGLVVPVLRDADTLGFAAIEQRIGDFGEKVKTNKIALVDLEGGTFTISNGGIYGSLLSTPILNVPQSGVLGMHAIQDRPVAHEGEVVIRPMMNLALSYDHRIIDGRQAVGFLKLVKEYIEDPEELILDM